jgi:hypothetical protein
MLINVGKRKRLFPTGRASSVRQVISVTRTFNLVIVDQVLINVGKRKRKSYYSRRRRLSGITQFIDISRIVPILDQHTNEIKLNQHKSKLLLLISVRPKVTCITVSDHWQGITEYSVFILAPTNKIKVKNEELDLCNLCLLRKYIRRSVGGHAVAEYS